MDIELELVRLYDALPASVLGVCDYHGYVMIQWFKA